MAQKVSRLLSIMRWPRVRFSLRTLIAFTCLMAGAFNLAWHWAPWQEQWSVTTPQASRYQFLHDSRAVFARYEPPDEAAESPRLLIWETASGALLRSQQLDPPFKKWWMHAWPSTDSDYIFAYADEVRNPNAFQSSEEVRMCFWSFCLSDGHVRRLDLPKSPIAYSGRVRSPDGSRIVLWTQKELRLLDLRQNRLLVNRPLDGSIVSGIWASNSVASCVWAPSGRWLALKNDCTQGEKTEYSVRILDGWTLGEMGRITQEPPTGFGYLRVLDDRHLVISCGTNQSSPFLDEKPRGSLRSLIYDVDECVLLPEISGFVYDARVVQGQSLALVEDGGTCYRYDLDRGSFLNSIAMKRENAVWCDAHCVNGVDMRFTPDGQRIIQTGLNLYGHGEALEAGVYDATSGELMADLGRSYPTCSQDGRWVTDEENKVVRSTRSGAEVYCFSREGNVVFAPDGERLVVTEDGEEGDRLTFVVRRRPEQWWGLAWLHEFWLTVLLTGTFGWSCVHDRRQLRG
jgi:hypothetical protein